VSSFVFMKLLETSAARYDLGMRMLSVGRIGSLYRRVAARVPEGSTVLEVGCGTGGVTGELLARGCRVSGVDRSRQMLDVAGGKLAAAVGEGRLTLTEANITGLSRLFAAGTFDCVVCCLVLSELTRVEERYALDEFCRLLRPGGVLVLADEVAPASGGRWLAYRLQRLPLAALTYLLTQTTTHSARDLPGKLDRRGLVGVEAEALHGGSFQIVAGSKRTCALPAPA
jgi:demethylmenaquinone methyltransferase/2-methoxy-6-polyprenyl-1,4-benzoquinol methylase